MLSVTFQAPIIIDAANLNSLLSLANTPALVESHTPPVAETVPAKRVRSTKGASTPAAGGDKPKRTRATKAEMEARRAAAAGGGAPETPADPPKEEVKDPVEVPPPAAPVAEKPKRDRRSAAKKAADAAKEAGKAAPAPKKASAGKAKTTVETPSADAQALQDRFAQLIDKSFEQATALLAEFGVKRFSEVEAGKLGDFGAKLTELGV